MDLPVLRAGQRVGQEAELDLPADLQFPLVAEQFGVGRDVLHRPAELGPLVAVPQPRPHQVRVERRGEVVGAREHVLVEQVQVVLRERHHRGLLSLVVEPAGHRPHGVRGQSRGRQQHRHLGQPPRRGEHLAGAAHLHLGAHALQGAAQLCGHPVMLVQNQHLRLRHLRLVYSVGSWPASVPPGGRGSARRSITRVLTLRPATRSYAKTSTAVNAR